MNKKILMAAVGMALVAGPMMAQAAPTVYGKLNLGVASMDNGNDADSSTLAVTDNASRLGVKGDEDLGGGLKSIYMFETTIDGDNGGFGSARDVYAGMTGGFGSIRLGQFNSIYKNLSTGLEIFADTTADFSTYGLNGELREANQISYSSPNLSGLVLSLASSRGETGLDTESNPMMITATYDAGPLYIGIGTKDHDPANTATTGIEDSQKIAARFNMDAISVWAVLEKQNFKGDTSTQNELDTTHIGASYKMGNNTFAVTHTNTDSTMADSDTDALSLGVIHSMSKTTAVKVLYTTVDNSSAASRSGSTLNGASLTATANDKDPSALEVQLSVSF